MKTQFHLLSLAALALAIPAAYGQTATTAPVGYRTETIKGGGVINLIGLNLTTPVGSAGILDNVAGTTLTDNEASFTTSFTPGTRLFLKITEGANAGITADVTSFTATTITTTQDISAAVAVGNKYELRAADTVSNVFGATNSAGLLPGGPTTADLLYIVNLAGGFDIVFYSNGGLLGTGWRKVGGGPADAGATGIAYPDSLLLYRKGATDISLVLTGHVVNTKTIVGLETGLNYVSRVLPVGVSLAASGLQPSLTPGGPTTADRVFNPDGLGGYTIYFYSNGGLLGTGWRKVGGGPADVSADLLASGFLLDRKGAATNATLEIPGTLDI